MANDVADRTRVPSPSVHGDRGGHTAEAEIWLDHTVSHRRQASWVLRGPCIVTDATPLRGSGQLFVAARDCAPIDVHFTDESGTRHDVLDAGVVEIRWEPEDEVGVEIYVHEPPTSQP